MFFNFSLLPVPLRSSPTIKFYILFSPVFQKHEIKPTKKHCKNEKKNQNKQAKDKTKKKVPNETKGLQKYH